MTTNLSERIFATLESCESASLRVSIIYEDFASGVRAKACVDRLAQSLNVGPEAFTVQLWSFSYLADPSLRSLAAREAAGFEMVLLATRGCGEPPANVKEWMAEWLQYRESRPCALAVMPEDGGQNYAGGPALLRYVSRIAEAGGLDLVHPFGEPPKEPSRQTVQDIARRAINASPLLSEIVDDWQSYRHSGINE